MPEETSLEEKRERAISLELIGGIVLFFDFLVLFFMPAGLKVGTHFGFAAILSAVAVASFALVIWGHVLRMRAGRG